MDLTDVRTRVDAAFADGGWAGRGWPDPHPHLTPPLEEEYSRCLDPEKYRVLGARADAWATALTDLDLASVEELDLATLSPRWSRTAHRVDQARRLVPAAEGALPLVDLRTRFGDDASVGFGLGVSLGPGDPPAMWDAFPGCGCDACDNGSEDLLEDLDTVVVAVITGVFHWRSMGDRSYLDLGSRAVGTESLTRPGARLTADVRGAAWF